MELTLARRGRQLLAGAPAAAQDRLARSIEGLPRASRRRLGVDSWRGGARHGSEAADSADVLRRTRKGRRPRCVRTSAISQKALGISPRRRRLLLISAFALGIGVVSAYVALALIRLNRPLHESVLLQRWSTALVSPEGHTLGSFVVAVPVAGALVIGVMAPLRIGADSRPRDPEAIEAILINGSRVEPRVAILKPLSSAISIGSGGPFGAEGRSS